MTTFTSPLIIEGANNPKIGTQTDTSAFVHCTKIVPLNGAAIAPRAIITLPPFSILTNARAYATSAFAADVSAINVNFGNSSDATRYGVITVSALGQIRGALTSAAADFNTQTGGTMVITGSAVSTATFTAGGAIALVEYIVVG